MEGRGRGEWVYPGGLWRRSQMSMDFMMPVSTAGMSSHVPFFIFFLHVCPARIGEILHASHGVAAQRRNIGVCEESRVREQGKQVVR